MTTRDRSSSSASDHERLDAIRQELAQEDIIGPMPILDDLRWLLDRLAALEHERDEMVEREQRAHERHRVFCQDIARNLGPIADGLPRLALDSALSHDVAELHRERDELRDWQATTTVALGREGGSFFADVPKHIRELKQRAEHAEAALLSLQTAARELKEQAERDEQAECREAADFGRLAAIESDLMVVVVHRRSEAAHRTLAQVYRYYADKFAALLPDTAGMIRTKEDDASARVDGDTQAATDRIYRGDTTR